MRYIQKITTLKFDYCTGQSYDFGVLLVFFWQIVGGHTKNEFGQENYVWLAFAPADRTM
jgi:hypothetical protein